MSDDKKVVHLQVAKTDEPSTKELQRKFLKEASESAGFPINLDLRFDPFVFSGSGSGTMGKPESHSVSITVHGRVREYAYPLAAIRFNRDNWEKFKREADKFFESLSKTSTQ